MTVRPASLAALILSLLMATATAAQATTVCERLVTKLANLPKVVSTSAPPRDYTGAISRQNIDLRRARNDMRRLGCSSGSIIVVGGPNEQACSSLNAMIDEMETNLDTLKARRRTLVSGGDDATRRRILTALDLNRCAEEQDEVLKVSIEEPEVHRNILKDLPPIGETYPSQRGSADITDFSLSGEENEGALRTMCVRTCDGAFFPISSNATPADFQRDAEACHRRCPGADTELYYHALTTQESDQMVSASTGEPYAALPTAFAYRTRDLGQSGQCGCAPVTLSGTGKAGNQSSAQDGSGIVQIRTRKPVDQQQEKAMVPDRPYDPENSKVRVVGPSFLPPQESSIDLKHPAGPGYQQVQSN